jgi:4-alpha-glucanotransferase
MKLIFQLRFATQAGQSIRLTGNHELLGSGDLARAIPMESDGGEFCRATVELRGRAPDAEIAYNYVVRNSGGSAVQDWGSDRTINPAMLNAKEAVLIDAWNDAGFVENVFYTAPFQEVFLNQKPAAVRSARPRRVTHLFKAKAPILAAGQTLCLIGSAPALGGWNTEHPVLMSRKTGEPFFTVAMDLSGESMPIAYKYGVWDADAGRWVRFEDGADRNMVEGAAEGRLVILHDGFARLAAPTWRGAGVAIPVFSLRSEGSFGVGEFSDLMPLADWAERTGLRLIQILPVNDTTATHTWRDCYPYSAVSAFAMHPMYINLARVAGARHAALLEQLEPERRRLNAPDSLDYEGVMKAKLGALRELFAAEGARTLESAGYREFFEENSDWLAPYAAFCLLRDRYGTADFAAWPEHQKCSTETIAELADGEAARGEWGFHCFIQYHLHRQLAEARDYARKRGVVLKGDLAIGVSRCSADVWQAPELYHTEMQAGAPPDAFAEKGQNWGFPTYNWVRMEQDGFLWWRRRLRRMARYFDAYRIDHILGFFRIWSIPADAVDGVMGRFVPALPVSVSEFGAREIPFDRRRYVQPYITGDILRGLFGSGHQRVRKEFLEADRSANYTLREEFRTQRQVKRHFGALEDTARNRRTRQGLFDLIANVILFEAEGSHGEKFHFRWEMEKTASFRQLDEDTQRKLKDLYNDYFNRRQDRFWESQAMEKLPALKRATDMLVCGEDLGMVPACVPGTMRRLAILSLEVQRMPPKGHSQGFSSPKNAPYLSVVTPGTHDMTTVRGWWEEDAKATARFYHEELGESGEPPKTCEPRIVRAILRQHLASPAMWSILQLQDLLGMDAKLRRANPADERINVPSDPKHYWQYRMHLTLEALNKADAFNEALREEVRRGGRA